jgi:hypothetical protein
MSKDIFNVFTAEAEPFVQIYTSEFKARNIMTQHNLCSTLTWKFRDCCLETGTPSRYAIFVGLVELSVYFQPLKLPSFCTVEE